MKTWIIRLVWLLASVLPLQIAAQSNITKAFDKLLKCSDVVYNESHSLDRNSQTGIKESQSDIYRFTMPIDKKSLIDNILKAFDADNEMAYSTSSGIATKRDNRISVAVGNNDLVSVEVNPAGYNYVYSLFIAPEKENPSGNYRYAYGINWKEKDGEISGKIFITYATTLAYRQSQYCNSAKVISINDFATDTIENEQWFSTLMGYIQGMETVKADTPRQAIASRIYEHSKSIPLSVDEKDKSLARDILKDMAKQPGTSSVTARLLNAAISNIK